MRRPLFIDNRPIIFDGAMGTMIQKKTGDSIELPDLLNITDPELIYQIHKEYIDAGADVITTNTFSSNRRKLKESSAVYDTIKAAVDIAKRAVKGTVCRIALDIGPLGVLLEPNGSFSFDEAYDYFKEEVVAGYDNGVDLIIIETMSDMAEAKAAALAAIENTDIPVILSMTFEKTGKTFMGLDCVAAAVSAQSWGVSAFGVNCSDGPENLFPTVQRIIDHTSCPVIVQANAGLPSLVNGKTIYSVTADDYALWAKRFFEIGASIIGGCCGTTPEYIKKIKQVVPSLIKERSNSITAFSGCRNAVIFDKDVVVIGERINPTGKKKLQAALRERDFPFVADEAVSQAEAGAVLLDINAGLPDINEKEVMFELVKTVQSVVGIGCVIDSSDPSAIEYSVRRYAGKPIINSVNGSEESMKNILPIAKKYGTGLICLTLDEKGIPETAEERLVIAERIYDRAIKQGIKKEDLIFDFLTMSASTSQKFVNESLKAIRIMKEKYDIKTTLGVSNVSFGLPSRQKLNVVFLMTALGAGLDSCIINPLLPEYKELLLAYRVLADVDKDAKDYIEYENDHQQIVTETAVIKEKKPESKDVFSGRFADIKTAVLHGQSGLVVELTNNYLKNEDPLAIINEGYIPALDVVGERFEKGTLFIPQLIAAAEAVKCGCNIIEKLDKSEKVYRGKVLMATVKGDVHDIGKNIVVMLLKNYGYEVVDLGKDVSPETIVETVIEQNIKLVGLSALMTTTVKYMKETIDLLHKKGCDCKVMVGGAVMNPKYAEQVGADFYAKDASESVKIANGVFA